MTERYKVVEGSQSGHCCFDYTIVDMNNKGWYEDEYESVCECFQLGDAELIVKALNFYEANKE